MAPPENPFPVHELPQRIHFKSTLHNADYQEKSRKLPEDFNILRDCELYELVQYSCTTQEELRESAMAALNDPTGAKVRPKQMECHPFVRLFRKCKYGNEAFNVETTAFEGRHVWKPKRNLLDEQAMSTSNQKGSEHENDTSWTSYLRSFWKG